MDVDIFHIWDDLRVGHSGKQACWNHGRIAERNYPPEVLFNIFLCSSHRIFASNPFCWRLVVYFILKQNGFCFGSMDFGPLDRVLLQKTVGSWILAPPRSKWKKKKKVQSLHHFHRRKLTWHNRWALQVEKIQSERHPWLWTVRF